MCSRVRGPLLFQKSTEIGITNQINFRRGCLVRLIWALLSVVALSIRPGACVRPNTIDNAQIQSQVGANACLMLNLGPRVRCNAA